MKKLEKFAEIRQCPIARCGNLATPDNRYSSGSCRRITPEFVSRCTRRKDVDTTSILAESDASVHRVSQLAEIFAN